MKKAFALLLMLAAQPVRAELPEPLTCLLRPDRSSDIGAETGGIVASVAVKRSDSVARGDLLVQLDDRLARADLARATIARDITGDKLSRAEAVTAGRGISAEEVATLRADAAMAEADFRRAELMVERARILAPFDGTVAEVGTEAGQLINVQPLLRLIDTRKLRAEIVLPAEAFGQVTPGDVLPLAVELTGSHVAGRVLTIGAYIDPNSNSFSVIAEIDNAAGAIPAGVSCSLMR